MTMGPSLVVEVVVFDTVTLCIKLRDLLRVNEVSMVLIFTRSHHEEPATIHDTVHGGVFADFIDEVLCRQDVATVANDIDVNDGNCA